MLTFWRCKSGHGLKTLCLLTKKSYYSIKQPVCYVTTINSNIWLIHLSKFLWIQIGITFRTYRFFFLLDTIKKAFPTNSEHHSIGLESSLKLIYLIEDIIKIYDNDYIWSTKMIICFTFHVSQLLFGKESEFGELWEGEAHLREYKVELKRSFPDNGRPRTWICLSHKFS